ncbi:MAG: hypothetical protein PHD11_01505 [Bacteroidales bacterium]|nr:hypothetical protein [Bacteroidales bacterium]MDD4670031.1 hypothetical protein [Bacteroidales bacterium]
MKKYLVLLILLIPFLTSCKRDDNMYSTKLMGMWVLDKQNGSDALTDDTFMLEFKSKSIVLYAAGHSVNNGTQWRESNGLTYSLNKDVIKMSGKDAVGRHIDAELKIIAMDSDTFTFKFIKKIIDAQNITDDTAYEMDKQTDHSDKAKILAMWEGKCITDGVGELHRWLYFEDGTYYYYYRENGKWIQKIDNEGTYFVYGDLLCTNWMNDYESAGKGPQFECWHIDFENNNKRMFWEGRRQGNKVVKYMMEVIELK